MFDYQKKRRYFGQTADDIKELTTAEIETLGGKNIRPGYRGVYFSANPDALYRINLRTALLNRVLAPLVSFTCRSTDDIYRAANRINWQKFISPEDTFAVFASLSNSRITHSQYAALRVKDAIVDFFRDKTGQRPSVDTRYPDLWLNLHIEQDQGVLSLDTSGGSLHRRSYRRKSVKAPMAETLAASIIRYSEWHGERPLYDPFCGSGTLLCEAYLYLSQTPPALFRRQFGFERLPDFDKELYTTVRDEAFARVKTVDAGLIAGSDIDEGAISASLRNCETLDKKGVIDITQQDIFDLDGLENRTIVCNPPYGIRLQHGADLSGFYKRFGDFLKQRCKGSTAYVYFGEREYIKKMGLRASWKKELSNGGLDGRLVRYDMY